MDNNLMYFKITNVDEKENNFIYHDGLNISDKSFYVNGLGLCFTTIEYIPTFYDDGIWIREVEFPKDDPEFRMAKAPGGIEWVANKIILGPKYSLFDIETYKKFGLDITKNDYIIDNASKIGNVAFLNWWKISGFDLKYSKWSMDLASFHGFVIILDWWLDSGIEMKYTERAIDFASANGRTDILDWWLKKKLESKLELKYSTDAIDLASANYHINVLEWWKKSGLELIYSTFAIDELSKNKQDTKSLNKSFKTMNWWKHSGLEIKYSDPGGDYFFKGTTKVTMNGYVNDAIMGAETGTLTGTLTGTPTGTAMDLTLATINRTACYIINEYTHESKNLNEYAYLTKPIFYDNETKDHIVHNAKEIFDVLNMEFIVGGEDIDYDDPKI